MLQYSPRKLLPLHNSALFLLRQLCLLCCRRLLASFLVSNLIIFPGLVIPRSSDPHTQTIPSELHHRISPRPKSSWASCELGWQGLMNCSRTMLRWAGTRGLSFSRVSFGASVCLWDGRLRHGHSWSYHVLALECRGGSIATSAECSFYLIVCRRR